MQRNNMQNTYPMTLTTPRLKTEITIERLDNDIVMFIPGFGRWLMEEDISSEGLFAVGFLPEDDDLFKPLEFESVAFFWYDWLEDIMMTEGIDSHAVQFQYVMYHLADKVNIIGFD